MLCIPSSYEAAGRSQWALHEIATSITASVSWRLVDFINILRPKSRLSKEKVECLMRLSQALSFVGYPDSRCARALRRRNSTSYLVLSFKIAIAISMVHRTGGGSKYLSEDKGGNIRRDFIRSEKKHNAYPASYNAVKKYCASLTVTPSRI